MPDVGCARAGGELEIKITVADYFTQMERRDRLTDLGQIWHT